MRGEVGEHGEELVPGLGGGMRGIESYINTYTNTYINIPYLVVNAKEEVGLYIIKCHMYMIQSE